MAIRWFSWRRKGSSSVQSAFPDAEPEGIREGFTKNYGLKLLVWYEYCDTMIEAIKHEKQLKKWNRGRKIELIEKINPTWRDLSDDIGLP
jgi:predicted GIY-YIG superfamily endonuclease